jgi:hypothetical protein
LSKAKIPSYTLSSSNTFFVNADSYSAEAFQVGLTKFAIYLEKGDSLGGIRVIYLQFINTRPSFYNEPLGELKLHFQGFNIQRQDLTCPFDCSLKGKCVKNMCECNRGWIGTICNIPAFPINGTTDDYITLTGQYIYFTSQ